MRRSAPRFAALGVCLGALGVAVLVPALAPAAASLTIAKTDNADEADHIDIFADLIYTIEVGNSGPDPAVGVVVTDPLPAGLNFVGVTSTQGDPCEYRKRLVECALGTIPSGAGATVRITVRPDRDGRFINTATVNSAEPYAQEFSDSERTIVLNVPESNRRCGGKAVTIIGTPEADRLRGTPKRDVVASLGGNDVISGLGGNDVICGSAGADILRGGGANDLVVGGAGNDRLLGGPGGDRCVGGAGKDVSLGCER